LVSLDIEALLGWEPIAADRKRLLGVLADALIEASESCDVGLSEGRATAAWTPDALTVAIAARGIGGSSTVACLAGDEALESAVGPVALESTDQSHTLVVGEQTMTAHAPDDDMLVVVVPRTEAAPSAAELELGLSADSALAGALARVDASRPLWAVAAGADSTPWPSAWSGAEDIAVAVAFDEDGAAFDVRAAWNDSADVDALRASFDAALTSIYLPASIAARLELEADEELAAAVELTRGELYAADLRWIGAPPPPPVDRRSDDRPEEVDALLAKWAEQSTVGNAKVAMSLPPDSDLLLGKYEKIGVPECDQHIELYGKCIDDKFPEAAREASLEALEISIDAWRKVAASPGKAGLAAACKTAQDAVRAACA